jgi:hypothetical protein
VVPPAGAGWAGRRAIATVRRTAAPSRGRERLRPRVGMGTVELSGGMGVNGVHGRGALAGLAAACLALAGPAAAQSPNPDAAPGPSPDPAPTKTQPAAKPAAKPPTQSQSVAPQTTTAAPSAPSPESGATTTHRTTAPKRTTHHPKRHKATTRRPTAPPLPQLKPAQLLASPSDGDDRARRLAIGAVALLLLSLASATLIAVSARAERRRVIR